MHPGFVSSHLTRRCLCMIISKINQGYQTLSARLPLLRELTCMSSSRSLSVAHSFAALDSWMNAQARPDRGPKTDCRTCTRLGRDASMPLFVSSSMCSCRIKNRDPPVPEYHQLGKDLEVKFKAGTFESRDSDGSKGLSRIVDFGRLSSVGCSSARRSRASSFRVAHDNNAKGSSLESEQNMPQRMRFLALWLIYDGVIKCMGSVG
jgi:hypothetical protein